MSELLSCPFCGSDVVELTDDESKTRCEHCGAEGPKFHLFNGKKRIKAWNTRNKPSPEASVDEVEELAKHIEAACVVKDRLKRAVYILDKGYRRGKEKG